MDFLPDIKRTPQHLKSTPFPGCFSICNRPPERIYPVDLRGEIASKSKGSLDPCNYRLVIYSFHSSSTFDSFNSSYCLLDLRTSKVVFEEYVARKSLRRGREEMAAFRVYDPKDKKCYTILVAVADYIPNHNSHLPTWTPLEVEGYIGDTRVASFTYSSKKAVFSSEDIIGEQIYEQLDKRTCQKILGCFWLHDLNPLILNDDVDLEPRTPVSWDLIDTGRFFIRKYPDSNAMTIAFKFGRCKLIDISKIENGVIMSQGLTNNHLSSRGIYHNPQVHQVIRGLKSGYLPMTSVFYLDGHRIGETYD